MSVTTVTIEDVRAAQARIKGYVRRTPMMEAQPARKAATQAELYLKLECLQMTGSFKARGATNKLFSLNKEQLDRGLVTASGGNHGLGVAYAGWLANVPATIFLPRSTPPAKAEKLASWGARVVWDGQVWDEANQAALDFAHQNGMAYFHPFADAAVIAGQGTISLEILEDVPDVDVLLVAIGGGGLISGVSLVAKAINPTIRVIGIEPTGAPTLYRSLEAGKVVELSEISTAAGTLAPRQSGAINFDIIRQNVAEIVLVTDADMINAARWLWFEFGIAAELSGAAAVAALLSGKVTVTSGEKVCALVCGAGTDGV